MIHFVAPPGWPSGPVGWLPPSDWAPDDHWPTPPRGWVFYVDEYGMPADPGPYHWAPVVASGFSARSASSPVHPETSVLGPDFPAYRPGASHHRTASDRLAAPQGLAPLDPPDKPDRGPRGAVTVVTLLLLAALAAVAVFLVRPVVEDLPLHPGRTSAPVTLPPPDDVHAAALESLGFHCGTERLDPVMVGCRQRVSDEVSVTARWVLDEDDEISTFWLYGNSLGQASDTLHLSLAALLQLTTDDPQLEVLTTLTDLPEGTEERIELDWGSVDLVDFGAAGLQQVTAVRADGAPDPLQVKQFAGSTSEVEQALDEAGVACRQPEEGIIVCGKGRDRVDIRTDGELVISLRADLRVDQDHLRAVLRAVVDGGEVAPVEDELLAVAHTNPAATPWTSVAGYLAIGDGEQVLLTRVTGWW